MQSIFSKNRFFPTLAEFCGKQPFYTYTRAKTTQTNFLTDANNILNYMVIHIYVHPERFFKKFNQAKFSHLWTKNSNLPITNFKNPKNDTDSSFSNIFTKKWFIHKITNPKKSHHRFFLLK